MKANGIPDPTRPLQFEGTGAIPDAFLRQALRTPGSLAVSSDRGACSYGTLDVASRALAQHLAARGVGPGHVVAILTDRSPALVCAALGVLRAGAAFYLADAAYPPARLARCVERIAPAILLATGEVVVPRELSTRVPAMLRVDDDVAALPAAMSCAPTTPVTVEARGALANVAYVGFTSGSTGEPKGILTGHAPLQHFVRWHAERHGFTPADRFSMLSGISHDPLLRDIFTPLSIGATLCIPDQRTVFDPASLADWLARNRITSCHLTPALGEIISAGLDGRTLPDLRYLFWGGDVLTRKMSARLRAVAPHAAQVNFYGATETPQAMASYSVPADGDDELFPIGHGIDAVQILVVNDQRQLCQPGEIGEIWIRTPYLSHGYLNDAEQTRARFVSNPFTQDVGDVCYRTGDLGRYVDDGDVVFTGRSDHQIKIRGFRVELGEIVNAIEHHPSVRRALVVARDLGVNGRSLVAYYTCEPARTLCGDELRQTLRHTLPSYMVPSHLVRLDDFPLMPNGKVNLSTLPPPERQDEERAGYVAPATEQERELVKAWQEILGVERVGVNDSFLDLGGDSLSALKALIRMRKLGLPDEVARGILRGRTIAQLVRGEDLEAGATGPLPPDAKGNLVVNVLRGILLTVVVTDHWFAGLLNRLPAGLGALQASLAPLFNLATPGFALVFGLSLGYTFYPKHKSNPAQARKMLRFAGWVLASAILVSSGSDLMLQAMRGATIDSHVFFISFFGALLYYALAVASADLWFRLIARWKRELAACAVLIVGSFVLYRVCVWYLLDREQSGFLQLCRLMLVAKFSYFNMSVGALAGVAAGIWYRRTAGTSVTRRVAIVGAAGIASGLSLLYLAHGTLAPLRDADDMGAWRWLFYGGAVLVLASVIDAALTRHAALPRPVRTAFHVTSVLGQLTLPIFVLHGLVLKWKGLLVVMGLPPAAALGVTVGAFFVICGWLMHRLYALYYAASPGTAVAGHAVAPRAP